MISIIIYLLKILFIYLAMPGLSCGMWNLVPWPGIKPCPASLGAWTLNHRITREVPQLLFKLGKNTDMSIKKKKPVGKD